MVETVEYEALISAIKYNRRVDPVLVGIIQEFLKLHDEEQHYFLAATKANTILSHFPFDSLDIIDIVMQYEKETNCSIPDYELDYELDNFINMTLGQVTVLLENIKIK